MSLVIGLLIGMPIGGTLSVLFLLFLQGASRHDLKE